MGKVRGRQREIRDKETKEQEQGGEAEGACWEGAGGADPLRTSRAHAAHTSLSSKLPSLWSFAGTAGDAGCAGVAVIANGGSPLGRPWGGGRLAFPRPVWPGGVTGVRPRTRPLSPPSAGGGLGARTAKRTAMNTQATAWQQVRASGGQGVGLAGLAGSGPWGCSLVLSGHRL